MEAAPEMRFQFFPLRFEFVTRDPLYFPPGKAGNMLRGALGFAPTATVLSPSGLSDPPRPFVFRARHLDGGSLQPDEPFHFDLHFFSLDPEVLACFVSTFAELAREGLGSRRAKAELQRVRCLALNDLPEQILFENSAQRSVEPATLNLDPIPSAPRKIRIDFLSPTELKHDSRIVNRPEFPILLARIRDRVSTLRAIYGPGPLAIDFQEMGERAASVRMTRCEIRRQEVERRSTRTGQTHSIGGFVGFAEYEGEMAEFLPYLEAARWTGVGRQVVWGKGEIAVESPFPGEH
jgi:hypothetical protein